MPAAAVPSHRLARLGCAPPPSHAHRARGRFGPARHPLLSDQGHHVGAWRRDSSGAKARHRLPAVADRRSRAYTIRARRGTSLRPCWHQHPSTTTHSTGLPARRAVEVRPFRRIDGLGRRRLVLRRRCSHGDVPDSSPPRCRRRARGRARRFPVPPCAHPDVLLTVCSRKRAPAVQPRCGAARHLPWAGAPKRGAVAAQGLPVTRLRAAPLPSAIRDQGPAHRTAPPGTVLLPCYV